MCGCSDNDELMFSYLLHLFTFLQECEPAKHVLWTIIETSKKWT